MKTRIGRIASLALLALIASLAGLQSAAAQTATPTDDAALINVTSLAQLNAMRWDLDGNGSADSPTNAASYAAAFGSVVTCPTTGCEGYELRESLDFDTHGDDDIVDVNDSYPNWIPIGTQDAPFTATFDGGGNSITRLTISSALPQVGLFGRLNGATVKNLKLLDADVNADPPADDSSSGAGVLAGVIVGDVSDVYVSGTLSGDARHMGGMAGIVVTRSTIESSCANVEIDSESSSAKAGGLVGMVNSGRGSVKILASCAFGGVSASGASANAGGFAGLSKGDSVKILAAYARGGASAPGARSIAGGFLGKSAAATANLSITAAYSAGVPSASSGGHAGAFLGSGNATVAYSYWDVQTSGIPATSDTSKGEGKTTSDLQTQVSASGIYANWNKLDIKNDGTANDAPWSFETRSQYPVLVWGELTAADQYIDYDSNDDGLIEITALAQLDAMRYDLNGDGSVDAAANSAKYAAAFPNAASGMGCPTTGCNGYELKNDLTFDANDDGGVDSQDPIPNWTPIGDDANRFAATFDGGGKTVSYMKIDSAARYVGMFGFVSSSGKVKGVGLRRATVNATRSGPDASFVGALVGRNAGTISASYATGYVTAAGNTVGGLVGGNNGRIAGCWANVDVASLRASEPRAGGLTGVNYHTIVASYSLGNVEVRERHRVAGFSAVAGGKIRAAKIAASYSIGEPTIGGTTKDKRGFVDYLWIRRRASVTISDSYWNTETSQVVDATEMSKGIGKTTAQLQNPTSAAAGGIYAKWKNLDLLDADGDGDLYDGAAAVAVAADRDPWHFGTNKQYPVLNWGGMSAADQYVNYDANGLIEITNLRQLDAIRYDLNGDGIVDNADNKAKYDRAFPHFASGTTCPSAATCKGYKLKNHLSFDTNGDGAVDSKDWHPNWKPIGDDSNPFTGTFDGNGKTISHLTMSGADADNIILKQTGLFGKLSGATVKNLRLRKADVKSTSTESGSGSGALAGSAASSKIFNVRADGTVSGTARNMGGLVGVASPATLVDSSGADVDVASAGALAKVGGLVGSATSAKIFGSYATGGVSASRASANAGGLAGTATDGNMIIRAAYATGGVSATATGSTAGGLLGTSTAAQAANLKIEASYSTGKVSAGGTAGAFIGSGKAAISYSYWDATTSGDDDDSDSNAPEGRTTVQLQNPVSVAAVIYADWDDLDLTDDGATNAVDDPWDLGTSRQYPALIWGGLSADDQRADYDADDDGLIEITALAQLDAVRHDLDGDGAPADSLSDADKNKYYAAFSNALAGMGCPSACEGYELGKSLDFVDDDPSGAYANWLPIGAQDAPFTATFDGGGYKLSNMTITSVSARIGLFGRLAGATVKNLRLTDVDVTANPPATDTSSVAGALAGIIAGNISNVYASGTVDGTARHVGGLVGIATPAVIESSCANVAASSTTGGAKVGGLIGMVNATNKTVDILASCALGDVSASGASAKAGGLVGSAKGANVNIRSSYACGDVSAGARSIAGGLLGRNEGTGANKLNISASYSTGSVAVTIGNQKGGFIGAAGSSTLTVAHSYWDVATSGIAAASDTSKGEGKTTAQLKSPTAATAASIYANWDASVWSFGTASQYPILIADGISAADQQCE